MLHAKSIYLCNDDEHLLLIGSDNVTFGGHRKNTEVFEALAPDGAASAFEDFSGLLYSGSCRDVALRSEGGGRSASVDLADQPVDMLYFSIFYRLMMFIEQLLRNLSMTAYESGGQLILKLVVCKANRR